MKKKIVDKTWIQCKVSKNLTRRQIRICTVDPQLFGIQIRAYNRSLQT